MPLSSSSSEHCLLRWPLLKDWGQMGMRQNVRNAAKRLILDSRETHMTLKTMLSSWILMYSYVSSLFANLHWNWRVTMSVRFFWGEGLMKLQDYADNEHKEESHRCVSLLNLGFIFWRKKMLTERKLMRKGYTSLELCTFKFKNPCILLRWDNYSVWNLSVVSWSHC
jgi:hypothetical protein